MSQQDSALSGLLRPLELVGSFPGVPCAASERLGWSGMEALRYRDQGANEAVQPAITHHSLLLFLRTPSEFEAATSGIDRVVPPPAGSILVVPAGHAVRWR